MGLDCFGNYRADPVFSRGELEALLAATDKFVQEIFDAVSPLGRVDFLHQVYGFRIDVEAKLSKTGTESGE